MHHGEHEGHNADAKKKKTPLDRAILESNVVTATIEKLCLCPECPGPIKAELRTITIAAHVAMSCASSECFFKCSSNKPARARPIQDLHTKHERNTDCAINVLCVLGFLSVGDGSTEASQLLGLLGPPNNATVEGRSFDTIEKRR